MKNSVLVETLLNDMYNIIKSTLSKDVYSFKGGFILKKVLEKNTVTKDIRRTTDIDLSILNEETFELIEGSLECYLSRLKGNGVIHSYKFKTPSFKNGRNVSGGVKVYVKSGFNEKKRILCGIDISYHPLDYGLILFNDGSTVYSLERMLADKICVMYSDEVTLLKRVRDILDIYLIMKFLGSIHNLNVNELLLCLRKRILESNLNFYKISTLELMVSKKDKWETLYNRFNSLVRSERVSGYLIKSSDISKYVSEVIKFINFVVSKL